MSYLVDVMLIAKESELLVKKPKGYLIIITIHKISQNKED